MHHNLIRQHAALLWFASVFVGVMCRIRNCSAFCQTRRNSANTPQFGEHTAFSRQKAVHFFHGKKCRNPRIAPLYKTSHCGTAIKVRHTRWEKSGAHALHFQVPPQHVCCILLTYTIYRTGALLSAPRL